MYMDAGIRFEVGKLEAVVVLIQGQRYGDHAAGFSLRCVVFEENDGWSFSAYDLLYEKIDRAKFLADYNIFSESKFAYYLNAVFFFVFQVIVPLIVR